MTFGFSTSSVQGQCHADVNHDQQVDAIDLTLVLSAWGTDGSTTGSDINNDAFVDGVDLSILFSGWGQCTGPTWATVLEWAPDAAVVTNATLRNEITASGLPWRVRDISSNIQMLLIPAGTFTMGCNPIDKQCGVDESPLHQVTLSAFYMGRYEVTQAQWTARMGSNPSGYSGASDSPSRPVELVSWNMITSGSTSFMGLTGLRLPTEAEWERAYRAGTTTVFHSYLGQPNGFNTHNFLVNIAWYDVNSGNETHAVGSKFANALGLYDMSGNVWEWCQDWYGSTYYASSPLTNPAGPATGSTRVLRGGSWFFASELCRGSERNVGVPSGAGSNVGFRVARTP